MSLHIDKIIIFDWDGTLCLSPENTQENRAIWESATGRKWPHKGQKWWYEIETLDYEAFDIKLNPYVMQEAIKAIDDLSAYTVLLTGRAPKFSAYVKEICRRQGLSYFDAYYFNNESETGAFKLSKMDYLKSQFPNVKNFIMWEDREKHIPLFQEWGEKNYGSGFEMNIIKI